MTEMIDCIRCKGIGKIEKMILSDSQMGQCANKSCGVRVYGKSTIERMAQHDGLCIECAGIPTGLERITRKHEKCKYCGKEAWQH